MSPRAIVALGLAGAVVALVLWALLERSGRLGCEADKAELEAAYNVLAETAKRQSRAVADLEARGAQARAAGRQAAIAAAAEARARESKIDALSASLAAPTPAGKGCREALDEIRRAL
jgi:hypothetical protein